MEWIDGWPIVNKGKPIELVGHAEGLTMLPEAASWKDDFEGTGERPSEASRWVSTDTADFNLGWYTARVPLKPCYNLSIRPGSLAIRGGAHALDVGHCPTALLQKQVRLDCDWSTELEFSPTRQGEEAGTVVWLHESVHAGLAVRRKGEALQVIFRALEDGRVQVSRFSTSGLMK